MSNMFLQIEEIKGEAKVKDFEEQVIVQSFSYSTSQPTSPIRSNVGPTSGMASHSLFNFTKTTDKSSPEFCKHLWAGTVLPKAVFTVCRMDTGAYAKYLVITMEKFVVANYSVSGGGDVPYENIALNYSKIEINYLPQKDEGGMDGNVPASYDLSLNAEK